MNFKSIMLASAAGLMTATVASAADLPGEAMPSAVDYVKVCDTFGAGFFYIPGTETCLDISGRVRFRTQWDHTDAFDTLRFRADARVDFDARTSTEMGTLRSFIRLGDELSESFSRESLGSADTNDLEIDSAFIQLGYFTFGLHGDVANGDVLFGDNSFGFDTGDSDLVGITVLADDFGGGFYAGAGIYSSRGGRSNIIWGEDDIDDFAAISFQGAVGIADQPWGAVDLSVVYVYNDAYQGIGQIEDIFSVKGTADLSVAEGVDARLTASYLEEGDFDKFEVSGAIAFAVSDAATIYTGAVYDMRDGLDAWGANLGVDYVLVPGLVGTAEVSYADTGPSDAFVGMLQLSRSW